MDNKTYVVVGGVAGGAGVSARIRRLDENATIIMYEKGPYVSFANCGLPYYAGGTIAERDRLFVTPVSTLTDVFKIDVKTNTEVVAINRKTKSINAVNVETGEKSTQSYDHLILSPGSQPFKPPFKGVDNKRVLTVRNVPDIDRVVSAMHGAKKAVVVGGGFVGIEMAENLKEKGLDVSLVEAADQVMITLDKEMVAPVHQTLRDNGIKLYLNQALKEITDNDTSVDVVLPDATIKNVDFVILSIGVRPDSKIAIDAGIKVGPRGHIIIDENCLTSDKNISAIGDAIEYPSPNTKGNNAIALAGPVNKMARLCADYIVKGSCRPYKGTFGNSIAKVFDLNVGSVGLNEKTLKNLKMEYKAAVVHGSDHAGYYPGALPLSVKLLFSKETGEIYGGQAVGYRSVDKKLDVLSAIMGLGGTVEDLAGFEQSYAPPFNSAKDLLNMLGLIALNEIDGLENIVSFDEALKMRENGAIIVDVRTKEEWDLGHLDDSILIPHSEIRDNLDKLPKDRDIVLMCKVGLRGYIAERILEQHGFDRVFNLTGGYTTLSTALSDEKQLSLYCDDRDPEAGDFSKKLCDLKQSGPRVSLDCCGLQCPGPIVQLKKKVDAMEAGQVVEVTATDPGFLKDVSSWCKMTGNELLESGKDNGQITAIIQKACISSDPIASKNVAMAPAKNGASIVVFSNDFDKAIAALVLANGAAATGKSVTMFYTFWGLTVLRTNPRKKVKKDMMGKMFSGMLPSDMEHLKLSGMNFAGMGPKMMKSRMKKKNINQLREMFDQAVDQGVKMIACQMSMDIMGISEEELLPNAEIGGVATYMAAASECDVNLFI
jgi:NADPH-dependent 2,4-dienoyl-CoA reductase/sulfur reductase-like enzyme/peroxiredoxin family protein/rhodanese-related sulfurtransferase/TusA-related sulfurtransferase